MYTRIITHMTDFIYALSIGHTVNISYTHSIGHMAGMICTQHISPMVDMIYTTQHGSHGGHILYPHHRSDTPVSLASTGVSDTPVSLAPTGVSDTPVSLFGNTGVSDTPSAGDAAEVSCSNKQCNGHVSVLFSTEDERKLLNRSLEEKRCVLCSRGPIRYNKKMKAHLDNVHFKKHVSFNSVRMVACKLIECYNSSNAHYHCYHCS